MTEAAPAGEQIVERKLIVYKTLVDPTVVKVAGEKLKNKLFVRFWFLKPKPEEIQFVSVDKYYEPYVLVNGKYSIDYYRKSAYTVNVDEKVQEVILFDQKIKPKPVKKPSAKGYKMIKLEVEEHLLYEDKASLILDKTGREVPLKQLPSAPSEEHPKKTLAELGEDAKKLEIASDADVDVLRSKIVKRPTDIKRIVQELFEVTERALIYTPIYRVLFQHIKTGEVKALEFDGVTSERIS
ncbi:hypothetical protein GWO13_06705 [Candidatus Bathyarchaeota archaeon]|nr:hypothetical protein [Candidatus Bathyarchaeota archaeon]